MGSANGPVARRDRVTESELGTRFLAMCASVERELVLCAPFIKTGVIIRALEAVPTPTTIEVFTRWRPDEVAAGVCDTAILSLVEDRGGTVHLCDRLHAKYVRADAEAWVGSANLTAAALGWSATPNLELMLTVPATDLARRHVGKPVANAALLAGFAALSGLISLEAIEQAIREKLPERVADGNVAAARDAHAYVLEEMRELADAPSA